MGRKTKYNPKAVETICQAIADGVPYRFAAALGGISYETFRAWQRDKPAFSDAITLALAKGIQSRLQNMQKFGKKGNLKADMWWLSHVLPEHFAGNRVEIREQPVEPSPPIMTPPDEPVTSISPAHVKMILKKFFELNPEEAIDL